MTSPDDAWDPLPSDEEDRLTLLAAAERYEGLDWSQFELLEVRP